MAKNVTDLTGARNSKLTNGNGHGKAKGLRFGRFFTPAGGHARAQQASACFINSVQDSMESILDLAKTEGMLFKFGSGTGTNLSVLRSSREQLSGGGTASGPVSFMKGYDSFAGSIKSGGTTRRAAKMVILNADHPDVMDFIHSKANEERKAWALIEAGYNAGFNVPGGAYDSVQFQNANHSVRLTDDFMRAVIDDKDWETRAVVGGRTVDTYKARDLWKEIADAAWICGDPGLQFDSTIQDWNVVPNTGRINATNPCSEFVFLDDTACNLLSLNLMKFQSERGTFDVERFQRAIDITFTGQEILGSNASYPTPALDLGRGGQAGPGPRLPQRPGDRACPDRDDRADDGLRHHRHRARPGARQVQEAGRRRPAEDRQHHRAGGAAQARLRRDQCQGDRRVHRRERHHRGRSAPAGRAPQGLRLRLQAGQRHALHRADGSRPHDGRGPAVHLRLDVQDRQPPHRGDRRRDPADLHGILEARAQVHRDLPRWMQALAAAVHVARQGQEEGRSRR